VGQAAGGKGAARACRKGGRSAPPCLADGRENQAFASGILGKILPSLYQIAVNG